MNKWVKRVLSVLLVSVLVCGAAPSFIIGSGATDQAFTLQTKALAVGGGSNGTSYAVKADGTAWAWGHAYQGRLGNGDLSSAYGVVTKATPVLKSATEQLGNIRSVAAGNSMAYAVDSVGNVWSWGYNSNGQLGFGDTTTRPYATQIPDLSNVVDVAAMNSGAIALTRDGNVYTWGAIYYGQGPSQTFSQTTPIQIKELKSIRAIYACRHACFAIDANNDVWAWGNGTLGFAAYNNYRGVPLKVPGLNGIDYLSVGDGHRFAVKLDGTILAWGNNAGSQFGNGTTVSSQVPVTIPGDAFTGHKKLYANTYSPSYSNHQSAMLKNDGTFWMWGVFGWRTTWEGQGLVTVPGYTSSPTGPVPITQLSRITQVAFGGSNQGHILLGDSDGFIWAWGENSYGQTGIGVSNLGAYGSFLGTPRQVLVNNTTEAFTNLMQPQTVTFTLLTTTIQPATISDSPRIASGSANTYAICSDDSLWAWGRNNSGQLGMGYPSTTDQIVPLRIMGDIAAVAVDGNSVLALKKNEALLAWGVNTAGQLGDGSTTNIAAPKEILTDVVAFDIGGNHAAAILSDRSLWSWGANANGQVGVGTTSTNVVTPQKIMEDVAAVSVGTGMGFAIKTDGSLWGWGLANKMGDGTTSSTVYYTTPVKLADNIAQVSAGNNHIIAVTTSGDLIGWGNNSNGQLSGTITNYAEPISLAGGVKSAVAGSSATIYIKNDGIAYVMGLNTTGQLGVNSVTNVTAPQKITTPSTAIYASNGGTHSVIVDKDGFVWAAGVNTYGTLSDNTKTNQRVFVQTHGENGIGFFNIFNTSGIVNGTISVLNSAKALGVASEEEESELAFSYRDSYFSNPSTEYVHDLARMTLRLELASYTTAEAANKSPANFPSAINGGINNAIAPGYTIAADNIHNLYGMIGFTPIGYYNYDVPLNSEIDKVAYSLAEKRVVLNGQETVILAIVVRGGGYGGEWVSNGRLGTGEEHAGFSTASGPVLEAAKTQIASYPSDLPIKLWITGYSRGAAVANLVAANLNLYAMGVPNLTKENIYAYTFATPLNTKASNAKTNAYDNIFNIVNPVDIVPRVPLQSWGYTRYGIDKNLKYLLSGYPSFMYPEYNSLNQIYQDSFSSYKSSSDFGMKVNLAPKIHGYGLDLAIKLINLCVPSTSDFQRAQPLVEQLLQRFYTDNLSFDRELLLDVFGSINEDVTLGDLASQIAYTLSAGTNEQYNIITDFPRYFKCAHTPEAYLTVLDYFTKETAFASDSEIAEYSTAKEVTMACPVDVKIYSGSNEMVANVVNDEIIVAKIPSSVCGGIKKFLLLEDEQYRIEIFGNATGTLNVQFNELGLGFTVARSVDFYDLPVTSSIVYVSDSFSLAANESYVLTEQSTGSGIVPDFNSSDHPNHTHNFAEWVVVIPATVDKAGEKRRICACGKAEFFAYFEETHTPDYLVTVNGGTGATGGGNYTAGATVTITAGIPPAGQQFKNWTVNSGGITLTNANNASTTFTMPANAVTVTANFEALTLNTYLVMVNGGTGATGDGNYAAGAVVTITAGTPPAGKQFKNWTVNSGGVTLANANNASTTFAMPANAVTVTANFEANGTQVVAPTIVGDKNITVDYRGEKQLGSLVTGNGLTWSSSNTKYVTVDVATGKITSAKSFIKTGSVTITAQNNAGKVELSVKVKPTFMQWLMIIFLFGWIWY